MRGLASAVVAGLLVVSGTSASQSPALADVLERGAAYVASYAARVSGVVLEEEYMLIELGPRMQVPRRIGSDLVLINLAGTVIGLRDVFAIDKRPLRERTLRINTILENPTPEHWQVAQEYARQGYFHFLSELVVKVSEPALALQFIADQTQPKFTYRLDGRKRVNGVEVAGVRFQELKSRDAVYVLGTRGNAWTSGRIWLDSATGTVHQTELWVESATEVARTTVTYTSHHALGVWIPHETTETYESREPGAGPSGSSGALNLVHRLEGKARYSNPRYVPIDLTRVR